MPILTLRSYVEPFEVAFTYPSWASGLGCIGSECGYCCISETPPRVPRRFSTIVEKDVCAHYDWSKRSYRNYRDRPYPCRLFPLVMGVEDRTVRLSAMLGCPSTNINEQDTEMIESALMNGEISAILKESLNQNQIFVGSLLARNLAAILTQMENRVLEIVQSVKCFPFLSETWTSVCEIWHSNSKELSSSIPSLPTIRQILTKDTRYSGKAWKVRQTRVRYESKSSKTVLIDFDSWKKLKVASLKADIGIGELLRFILTHLSEEQIEQYAKETYEASTKDQDYWLWNRSKTVFLAKTS